MSSGTPQDKQALRGKILKQRQVFPHHDWQKASCALQHHLLAWPIFQQAQTVHVFLNQPHEVETFSIVRACWELGKTVGIPYLVPHSPLLGHSRLTHFEQLTHTRFNLQEPLAEARIPFDVRTIDLVLVPGVAFDLQGGRLGYGKGYYDRFLSQVEGFFLGLAFSFQIVPLVPQSDLDVAMDGILTEEGFLSKD